MTTETWIGAIGTDWNAPANWSGGTVPQYGDVAVVFPTAAGNAPTLNDTGLVGVTVELANNASDSVSDPSSVVFTNVTLDSGSSVQTAESPIYAGVSVQAGGTLTVGAGASIVPFSSPNGTLLNIGDVNTSASTIINDGIIASSPRSQVLLYAGNGLVNDGSIIANGSDLSIIGMSDVSGAGVVHIRNSAILDFGGDELDGGTIAFDDGTGRLVLSDTSGIPVEPVSNGTIAGFQAGDSIELIRVQADGLSYADGTLTLTSNGNVVAELPFTGSYTTADFSLASDQHGGSVITTDVSGAGAAPNLTLPTDKHVAVGGTANVAGISYADSFASTNQGAMFLNISADHGTLSALDRSGDAVPGSDTASIVVNGSYAQINDVLASLTYQATSYTGSDTVSFDIWDQAGVETKGSLPVTVEPSDGNDRSLTVPANVTFAAGSTDVISAAHYADGFAAGNPGLLFLGISDNSGTLSATNSSGSSLAGSGTNALTLQGNFDDVNAALASLHYAAGPSAGADTIRYDIWNQAGVETRASTSVTLSGTGAAPLALANDPSIDGIPPLH